MKILVVGGASAATIVAALQEHTVVSATPEGALLALALEEPEVIFCIAEYGRLSGSWKDMQVAYADIKRSIGANQRLVRLGFTPQQDPTDIYILLPCHPDVFLKELTMG